MQLYKYNEIWLVTNDDVWSQVTRFINNFHDRHSPVVKHWQITTRVTKKGVQVKSYITLFLHAVTGFKTQRAQWNLQLTVRFTIESFESNQSAVLWHFTITNCDAILTDCRQLVMWVFCVKLMITLLSSDSRGQHQRACWKEFTVAGSGELISVVYTHRSERRQLIWLKYGYIMNVCIASPMWYDVCTSYIKSPASLFSLRG